MAKVLHIKETVKQLQQSMKLALALIERLPNTDLTERRNRSIKIDHMNKKITDFSIYDMS